jgi:hypothetical protein
MHLNTVRSAQRQKSAFPDGGHAMRRAFASNECLKNNGAFEFGGKREWSHNFHI